MIIKIDTRYRYVSDYISIDDFCHELDCVFKELFICDLKREDYTFKIAFADGSRYKICVEEIKND